MAIKQQINQLHISIFSHWLGCPFWLEAVDTVTINAFRNEKKMIWKRLVLSLNILMAYETYTHIVVLGILLLPVLQGELIRPKVVFTAMLLVYQFVEAVVARMIIINVSYLSEALVAVKRSEVTKSFKTLLNPVLTI